MTEVVPLRSAGRGPDPMTMHVDEAREAHQNVERLIVEIERYFERYDEARQALELEHKVRWETSWSPLARGAFREWRRRHDPDVENIMPSFLRAEAT